MSWPAFPSLLVILSDLNPPPHPPLSFYLFILYLKQPASVIMEHQGLISRPGLQGDGTGHLINLPWPEHRTKEQLRKLLKNLATQQRRGQPVHANTKPPCDFSQHPPTPLSNNPQKCSCEGEKVIVSTRALLHCCHPSLAPWDRSILFPTESTLVVTYQILS